MYNMNDNTYFWNPQTNGFDENPNYNQPQNQSFGTFEPQAFEEHNDQMSGINGSQMYDPLRFPNQNNDFEEELPLLEELEIYPDRIFQKVLAVLNPFRSHGLTDDADYLNKDPDLAGPIFFYLILAVCLFLSGNKAHFGYIYGISVVSCLMMYCLLTLMTSTTNAFTLTSVASTLGYSLIPIISLSIFGLFLTLRSPIGFILAPILVFWSSISASRLFVAISGDKEQQPLIAYPCALVSAVYALLIIF